MALPTEPLGTVAIVEEGPASPSAVSWAAVIGGALTAVASTLLLVALGSRHWPFVGLTMVPGQSLRDDLHAVGRRVAYHRAMAVIGRLAAISPAASEPNGSGCIRTRFSSATPPTASSPGHSPRFSSPSSRPPRSLRQSAPQRKRFRMLPAARHPEPHRPLPLSRRFPPITSWTRCSDVTSRTQMLRSRTRGRRRGAYLRGPSRTEAWIQATRLTLRN